MKNNFLLAIVLLTCAQNQINAGDGQKPGSPTIGSVDHNLRLRRAIQYMPVIRVLATYAILDHLRTIPDHEISNYLTATPDKKAQMEQEFLNRIGATKREE